jgi:FkbM family methyltransferase
MQFYLTLLLKFIPGFSRKIVKLALKDGHVIAVREFMTLYVYKEIFIDRCYDVTVDRHDPMILDIGANTGLFALRMKQLFPSGKIFCYEPFPSNLDQLKSTILVNRLDEVVPIQKAVGARAGLARLYIHKRNLGGHSLYATEASSNNFIVVEVLEIGSVLDGISRDVDLLKADCEGAEFEILMALTARHAQKVRRVVIEPTPKLYDIKQLIAHMNSLGYSQTYREGLYLFSQT